jgi:MinD-like ATPase involved in chromosome partitioning or flagellar assembly
MRILFGLADAVPAAVERAATRAGHEVVGSAPTAAAIVARLDADRPTMLIVDGVPSRLSTDVLAACDERGIRVLAVAADDRAHRYVSLLGLFEKVDSLVDWAAVERAIAGKDRATRPRPVPQPEARSRQGMVVAVWGPAGAPGRTSIATAIAAELSSAGSVVALVDADTHAAAVAPALGLLDEAPGFAAACRLSGANSLTVAELDRIAEVYTSSHCSFRVLTGIGRPARWPELPTDRVLTTLRTCREWVDVTVVDVSHSLESDEEISSDLLAPRRNAATITAIREADVVVAVAAADTIGLARFLRAHVDLVELATTSQVHVLANKVRSTAIGMNPNAQVRQTLSRFGGIEDAVLVPHDPFAFDAALLSARTLLDTAPRSPARAAVQEFVRERLLGSATKRRGSSLVAR